MASRQCIVAVELEDIGREKFDGSLAKRQIRQYFLPSINCAIRYICACTQTKAQMNVTFSIQYS